MTTSSASGASIAQFNGVTQYYGTYNGISLQTLLQSEVQTLQAVNAPIQNQISTDNQMVTDWNNLKSNLSSLATATQALENLQTQNQAVTYSQSGYATATATNSATSGNYTLSIANLATNEKDLSNAQSSATSALGYSGSFSINGTSISVASTDSLSQIASNINKANVGVTANIIGTQMILTGNNTGKSNAITYSDPSGILTGIGVLNSSGAANNQLQAATNANYTLDGVALSSASNTITNVTNGINLTLTQATSSPITLTVSQNNSSIESAVQSFVSAYNSSVSQITKLSGKGGDLAGQSLPNSILFNMENAMSSYNMSGTTMMSMYDTGIQLNQNTKDGSITYNSSQLSTELQSNPTQTLSLLTQMAKQLYSQLNAATTSGGSIDGEVSSLNSSLTSLNNQLTQNQTMQSQQEKSLSQQFSQFQTTMSQLQMQQQYINAQISSLTGAPSSSGSSSSGG